MELLIGILCGIVLSLLFSFGPAFFGLIQNSVQNGFRRASWFAVGVSVSDIIVVFLMLTVLKSVDMEAAIHNIYVASIGGVGIILMGIYTFRKKMKTSRDKRGRLRFSNGEDVHRWQMLVHGCLLNILNPFIWIYWISVITLLSGEMELGPTDRYVFFAGLLMATLGCDLLKCRLASLLQTWFTARIMNTFNRVVGVALMAFGVYLIVAMVLYQTNPKIREKEHEKAPQSTKIIQQLHSHMAKDTAKNTDTIYLK